MSSSQASFSGKDAPTPAQSVAGSFAAERSIKRALLDELCRGWQENRPIPPEDLLQRWPSDPAQDADVASLLYEDFLQKQQHDPDVSVADYEQRFPAHKDSLAGLFRHHAVMRSLGQGGSAASTPRLALPDVGDELFGFRLQQELGRGAFARVYRAGQADLAERAVVLKVSGIDGNEPQVLAQLQHTHIVPIYSVHEDARAGLRAVCMPYFGGASLSQVLRACWAEDTQPRAGRQLAQALQVVQSPWPAPGAPAAAAAPPGLALLERLNFVQAAASLVARLAEALHHAHQRGVLHRDIKPSNILLGAEGEPMLLDFNLAQSSGGHFQAHATLGGTIAYMAPEHLRALAGRSAALTQQVDERADIYSLGMVLYEMLVGRTPFEHSVSYVLLPPQLEAMALERGRAAPSLRRGRADVPWGLESIARKCLAPDAAARYQSAGQLAEDLHAFLNDQPLRHAPELSRAERLRKWLRRHPRLTSSGSVAVLAAALLLSAGAALAGVHAHLTSTRQNLVVAEARQRKQDFDAGTQEALCLVNTLSEAQDHLPRGRAACEKTLALYDVLGRSDWQDAPLWQLLAPAEQLAGAEDVRELLLLLAWARTRLAPADPATLAAALHLLEKAEAIVGLPPSRAIWEERAAYQDQLGAPAEAASARAEAAKIAPATARDHCLLASAWVRNSNPADQAQTYARAARELTVALERKPRYYWAHLQRGICYQEMGESLLAAGDFATCIGLWPELAWGHFNHGYVLDRAGQKRAAIGAYTAALQRDPAFAPAYLNRGLARLELKEYSQALVDFDRAAELGQDEAPVHAGRGVALEGLGRGEEAERAFATAFARNRGAVDAAGLRLRWVYGFAVSHRLPDEAAAAFEEVLRHDPEQPQALYGRAMLAVERHNRLDEAIGLFSRALEAQPGFLEARRARAVLLSRRGQFEAAMQDVNTCLEKDGRGSATLYAAACVAARFSEKTKGAPRAEATGQALRFLRQALEAGAAPDRAEDDPDLASLRQHPEFRKMLKMT
jgi:eukaryotic-like serine/threonine-protein kinase